MLTVYSVTLFAQIETSTPQITRPTPSVASMMNFVDVPVNLYTGIPDINIPLYNLPTRSKDINVNLSLNYHPSGISFLDKSSDVGLGWGMLADGVISRTIIAQPDRLDYNPVQGRGFDDEFQFNFLGHSGTFLVQKNASDALVFVQKDDSTLKITFTTGTSSQNNVNYITSFTVYDDKGYRYVFDATDKTAGRFDESFPIEVVSNSFIESYTSAWHLTKVYDNNDNILVSYTYSATNVPAQSDYIDVIQKLQTITTPGFGTIELDYNLNVNLVFTANDPFQLDDVVVKNEANQIVKHFTFDYTFWNIMDENKRFLTTVKSYNTGDSQSKDYELFYERDFLGSNEMLPTDYHFETDEYGYLTYRRNCDIIDYEEIPETNPKVCYVGVLEKMKLPTGGSYVYQFESNTYSHHPNFVAQFENTPSANFDIDDYYTRNSENITPITYASTNYNTANATSWQFTVTGSESKKLYFKFEHTPYFSEDLPNEPLEVRYELTGNNQNINLSLLTESDDYCFGAQLLLAPGTYTINITTFYGEHTTGNITISEKTRNTSLKKWIYGGGLRIGKVSYYDSANSKIYLAGPGIYDGIPAKTDIYEYNYFDTPNQSSGNLDYGYWRGGSSQKTFGAQVCYLNVKVKNSDTNGYSKYYYASYRDNNLTSSSGSYYYSQYSLSFKRGLLNKSEVYDASHRILSSTQNVYQFLEFGDLLPFYPTETYSNNVFTRASSAKISSKTTRDYFYDATNTQRIVQTNSTYLYNPSNKMISESTANNSLGEVLKTKYYYHTGTTSITRNRISEIEKIETYRGTELLSTSSIDYANTWPGNISYLPQMIKSSKGSQPLENRVSFSQYDTFGNPTELQQVGGTSITYLWGYNKTQPIAKIENATNSQVAAALGFSTVNLVNESHLVAINNLRTNASLSNAMITTFTYIPLVGITTITDPKGDKLTYEYDDFKHLKRVRDRNNYILSENEYYYQVTNDYNFIKSTTYKTATTNPIASPTATQAIVNKTFFDGLGRAIQRIAHQQSDSGKDIVTPIAYDSLSRQTKEYLPYATTTASLNFYANALTEQAQYSDYVGQVAYSEKRIESSPLGRVLEQAAPGNEWSLNNADKHTIRFEYQTNSAADAVRKFTVVASETNYTTNGFYSIGLPIDHGFYPINQLYKSVTKNENWKSTDGNNNTMVEFKDKEGRVILKRTYGVSVVGAVETNTTHDTYYLYDQYNNLTYVIPPLADGTITSTILDELCYQYRYDKRNRIVEKKLPAKQWEYIVYDKLDRIIAAGPTLSPFTDAMPNTYGWTITKYDGLGRNILSAWTTGTNNSAYRKTLQDNYDNTTNPLFETRSATPTSINNVTFKYTNVSLPISDYHILSVNYFDDYGYPSAPVGFSSVMHDNSQTVFYNNSTNKPKGLATGSWIRVVEGINAPVRADISHVLYDNKARPVRHKTTNYLTGYTQVDSKIDFSGKVLYTETKHRRTALVTELYTREDFTYSNQDRLKTHVHKIGLSGPAQLLSKKEYDELGRVKAKRVGGTDVTTYVGLQKVDYNYNIRGWLTQINKTNDDTATPLQQGTDPMDLFAFKINYNTVEDGDEYDGKALFNGNISETYWRTSSDNKERKYGYQYDDMNRLKNAIYQKPGTGTNITNSYNESATYDKNGNIKSLQRNGDLDADNFTIEIDDLIYTYDTVRPNVVLQVSDSTNHPEGFKDGSNTGNDYSYDLNGNLTADQNKQISSIKYNHLNLPVEIIFVGTNKKINYLYNSAGGKVEKKVTNGNAVTITDYLGGYQYTKVNSGNVEMSFFPHAEGYVACTLSRNNNPLYDYVFNYTDHLGNIRVSYTWNTTTSSLKILEENHYFPFGLKHTKYNVETYAYIADNKDGEYYTGVIGVPPNNRSVYQYKLNGKEFQDELGLNMYAMDMRQYDPAIARWVVQDPVTHHNQSPYNGYDCNPVYWADPSGATVQDAYHSNGMDQQGRYKSNSLGMYIAPMDRAGKPGSNNSVGEEYSGEAAFSVSGESAEQLVTTLYQQIDIELNGLVDGIENDKKLNTNNQDSLNLYKLFKDVLENKIGETLTADQLIKKYGVPSEIKRAIKSIKVVAKNKVYVDWDNEGKINAVSKINIKDGTLTLTHKFIPTSKDGKKGINGFIIEGGGLNFQPSLFSSKTYSPVFVSSVNIYGYLPDTNTITKEGASL